MKIKVQFNSIQEIQRLQELANKVFEDVTLHSADDSVIVDAKSFIGLFSLNFNEELYIVTDSEKIAAKYDH